MKTIGRTYYLRVLIFVVIFIVLLFNRDDNLRQGIGTGLLMLMAAFLGWLSGRNGESL